MLTVMILVFVTAVSGLSAWGDEPMYRDNFTTLDGWEPLTFPKIETHSRYSVTNLQNRTVLKAEANASASGLIHTHVFNPHDTPILRWAWRVDNVLANGNAKRKDGDDYPLRIYILFDYDPKKASFGMRTKYAIARKLYGAYPPHASLNYIWANRKHDSRILTSPYTDRSKMVVMRAGADASGQWLAETVNILKDYQEAFGEAPPVRARLAVMSDADNTAGAATAFLDFIELAPQPAQEARQ